MNSIIENQKDHEACKEMARIKLREQIKWKKGLIDICVGTSWPSVLRKEIAELEKQLESI